MSRSIVCFLSFTVFIVAAGAQGEVHALAPFPDQAGARSTAKRLCALFTMAEASRYVGDTVKRTSEAGAGTGCQWVSGDEESEMMVQVVPASYYEAPTQARGYKPVPDVGSRGFVIPELGGWAAGAVIGDEFLKVSILGPGAAETSAVELLREARKRLAR